jgi:hypothetical protein
MSSNEKMLGIGLGVAAVVGIGIFALRKSGRAADVSSEYNETQTEENSTSSGGKTRRKKQNRNKSKRK